MRLGPSRQRARVSRALVLLSTLGVESAGVRRGIPERRAHLTLPPPGSNPGQSLSPERRRGVSPIEIHVSHGRRPSPVCQRISPPSVRNASLKRGAGVASDQADRLLVEFEFVGIDHRRQPAREIGAALGRDQQDFGRVAGDVSGPWIAPLALAVKDGEAVGEVRREGLGREPGPF